MLTVIFLLLGCQKNNESKSLERDAENASHVYCDCIQKNIFKYKYIEDLYVHCNMKISKQFRLYKYQYDYDKLDEIRKLNPKLYDSIEKFTAYLFNKADSCSRLPILKYPRRF